MFICCMSGAPEAGHSSLVWRPLPMAWVICLVAWTWSGCLRLQSPHCSEGPMCPKCTWSSGVWPQACFLLEALSWVLSHLLSSVGFCRAPTLPTLCWAAPAWILDDGADPGALHSWGPGRAAMDGQTWKTAQHWWPSAFGTWHSPFR